MYNACTLPLFIFQSLKLYDVGSLSLGVEQKELREEINFITHACCTVQLLQSRYGVFEMRYRQGTYGTECLKLNKQYPLSHIFNLKFGIVYGLSERGY